MNLSDNLKKIRKENNLSQEQLAEKLNVSRQSVSKWESGLAYPEMDKVLQLCKMFNLNIDELLNQDVKEVKSSKQSKNNFNKYVDDTLAYISKTVDMFSNMKFKQIFKCLFEQLIIVLVLLIVFSILGDILYKLFYNLLNTINLVNLVPVLSSIYSVISFVIGFILLIYIFKIRYLDYYKIVDKEDVVEEVNEDGKKEEKYVDIKRENVIIRDPKHSEYSFVSGLFKLIILFVKVFVVFIGLNFCASFVFFSVLLVISFLFVKTGLVFIGALLGIIGCLTINFIILYLIYCFIANKYPKKGLMGILFVLSLLVGGISIGLIAIGVKDFKFINDNDSEYLKKTEEVVKMQDNLFINDLYNVKEIEYIETDSKDIKIEYTHSPYCYIKSEFGESNHVYLECNNGKIIKEAIDTLNKKVFINPDLLYIKVYASKDNIKKMKENKEKYIDKINERNDTIKNLQEEIREKDKKINELEEKCD